MNRKEKPKKEVKFSDLSPLELWDRLGLNQKGGSVDNLTNEPFEDDGVIIPLNGHFESDEDGEAYKSFLEDFSKAKTQGKEKPKEDCKASMKKGIQPQKVENPIISPEKGSLFIWALLQTQRSGKLSSVNHVFKDEILKCMMDKGIAMAVEFDAQDFDEISKYLEGNKLIKTAKAAMRITQEFSNLFHERYGWLVF